MTTQGKILFEVAVPIILVGLFVIVIFAALNYDSLNLQVYAIFTAVAIFVFLFGFAIGQKFTTPIRQLLERADKLTKGDLGSRIYIETKDEFQELAEAFNKIAEDLERTHTEVDQAEGVADVRTRARTQELEEIVRNLEQKVQNRSQDYEKVMAELEKLQTIAKEKEGEVVVLKKETDELRAKSRKKA